MIDLIRVMVKFILLLIVAGIFCICFPHFALFIAIVAVALFILGVI